MFVLRLMFSEFWRMMGCPQNNLDLTIADKSVAEYLAKQN